MIELEPLTDQRDVSRDGRRRADSDPEGPRLSSCVPGVNVNPELAPNAPELLYWTCVLAPAGRLPAPPPGRHSKRLLAATQVSTNASLHDSGDFTRLPWMLAALAFVSDWAAPTPDMVKR